MASLISVAVVLLSLSTVALAEDAPSYVAPRPTGDAKSTIISGALMIVNGIIMSEADRRHSECATFVSGLDKQGFPLFRRLCRVPESQSQRQN